MKKLVTVALLSFCLLSTAVFASTYELDKSHSGVNFKIAHLGFGRVTGRFNEFKAKVNFEPGHSEKWMVDAEIQTDSINTGDAKRDTHLKSPDFFDAKKFPKITFKSTSVTDVSGENSKLHGDLTMHGVTKPVVLDLEVTGQGKDPWGNTRAGFSAKGKVNRKDFGIVYNKTLETGGLLVGEDVEITIEAETIAKK